MDQREEQQIMAGRDTDKTSEKLNPAELFAEGAGTAETDISEEEMKALALAYAKYLKDHGMAPGDATFAEPEEVELNVSGPVSFRVNAETAPPVRVEKPADETAPPAADGNASAQSGQQEAVIKVVNVEIPETPAVGSGSASPQPAEQPASFGLVPEDAAPVRPMPEKKPDKEELGKEKRKARKKKQQQKRKAKAKAKAKSAGSASAGARLPGTPGALAAVVEFHDRLQGSLDGRAEKIGKDFARSAHAIASTYRNTGRSIGYALLSVGIMAAALLIIFDYFTVYEYAYNGKILGYVNEQEEVTDVLEVAGKKLTQNSKGETGVEFVVKQNISFKQVDGTGKSTDDADTAVNKLIYMTDIETEAFGIFDGGRLTAIVRSSEEAEELLKQTMSELSTPDSGMRLVSADFSNELEIRSVNVLLGSVQSRRTAFRQMVEGGNMETYHIVESGETLTDLEESFGTESVNIYNEDNSEVITEVEQGDKVCIHTTVEPVSVEMVETGKLKEVVEYETIKKDSDEYYQGDTYVQQEGVNGVQIFEGTLKKVGGEVTERKEKSLEVIKEKKDKIILVGTAERPKTAPTGTYAMPIASYVVTSEFGGRWGRMHDGIDLGASTGTPIYATDGGTVVRATYYSGYGLCVDIDHENGRMTRYGHCSRLLVNAGDRVYQGQEIALVGNTGHSFGSHLHFEVRLNGTPQNPRNFVDF